MPQAKRQAIPERPRGRVERQRIALANSREFPRDPRGVATLGQTLEIQRKILLVTAQQFVGTLAIEQNRDIALFGQIKYAPLGELTGAAHRQFVEPDEIREIVDEAIDGGLDKMVLDLSGGDHVERVFCLVGVCAGELTGESVVDQVLAEQLPGDANDSA